MAPFAHFPSEIIHYNFSFLSEPDLATAELAKSRLINNLRMILQRPELFAYISAVFLVGDEGFESSPSSLNSEFPPDLALERFITVMEKTQTPYIELWVES
ncbi:unnamed protein product, partial [Clonostachys chloroleuca]